ncbi:hypothetical protein ACQPZP_36975 [Spirillospora sp. CA-142024]|uniref:hypothetical protein n=1 Tax=Spirillospora sp. CA-142024 TaxID=3240036 RepID=UPI003D91B857
MCEQVTCVLKIMKRAWSGGRVRITTVSAVVLAASAMSIAPAAGAGPVRGCVCAAGPACSRTAPRGGMAAPAEVPVSRDRTVRETHSSRAAALAWPHTISLPGGGDGVALKLSLYRGLGGGVTSSFTREGLAFTFESGVGVGGSFSVGSVRRLPDAGLSFEARASTSGRFRLIRPPDFGLTFSRDGRLRAYMDAKTGNLRTRFRSKSLPLIGGGSKGEAEAPATRRSWSLGTEFKLASTYTVRVPWGGLFGVWREMFGAVPGASGSQAPPVRSGGLLGLLAVLGRAVVRHSFEARLQGAGRRTGVADRFSGSKVLRVLRALRVMRGGRGTRSGRSRRATSSARVPRTGSRVGRPPAVPDEEPAVRS